MKLLPILTEKTLKEAKNGKYTFRVERGAKKPAIKRSVENLFKVEVLGVKTVKSGGTKKAIATLKSGKIDLFEEKKKK